MDRALTRVDERAVDRLIDREQARFAAMHARSAAAWARGREHYLYGGPSHWMRRWAGGFPIYAREAKGARLRDIDGRDYADFCLGDTGGMCGHGPQAVTDAVAKQISQGASMMLPTEDSLFVGEELARRFGLPYWTLTTSATDANRAAIRMARMITGRDKVLVFSGCYHGGVEEAHVQLVDGEMRMRNAIHPNGVDHARVTRVIEFNDAEALREALSHGGVACVLTEPVMTNFGMIPPAPGFHDALRAATEAAGALLIIDETHTISCGIGGYTREHGLKPDILTLGKAIAGGVPAGAFGVSREVADRMWRVAPWRNPRERQSSHMGMGGTLAGNALTVAAMRAVLSEVLTEAAYRQMFAMASAVAEGARRTVGKHGLSWHVTNIGARCEIMFGPKPPRNGAEASAMRQGGLETWLHAFFLNEGVLVTPFHTMLLACPATTPREVAEFDQAFARFVETALAEGAIVR